MEPYIHIFLTKVFPMALALGVVTFELRDLNKASKDGRCSTVSLCIGWASCILLLGIFLAFGWFVWWGLLESIIWLSCGIGFGLIAYRVGRAAFRSKMSGRMKINCDMKTLLLALSGKLAPEEARKIKSTPVWTEYIGSTVLGAITYILFHCVAIYGLVELTSLISTS